MCELCGKQFHSQLLKHVISRGKEPQHSVMQVTFKSIYTLILVDLQSGNALCAIASVRINVILRCINVPIPKKNI